MRRREFIVLLGGAAAAWPLAARAQQPPKIYHLGYLAPARIEHLIEALQAGLREFGYVEGRNLAIEYRFGSQPETLDALAAELVQLSPDVILTLGTPSVIAAKRATSAIPIVITSAGDPVRSGVVASLARPGGNVTGCALYNIEISGKRIELLKKAKPSIARVAVLANATNPINEYFWQDTQYAGRALGIETRRFDANTTRDLVAAFAAMRQHSPDALVVLSDSIFNAARQQIIGFAADQRIPATYEGREYVESGGLMSYGADIAYMNRLSATFVDKVLKGAKLAELPIQEPTKFELVINLKTAKALGLTVPPGLLVAADEVIE
jgi:putative ABC transport system substrate-binding protein